MKENMAEIRNITKRFDDHLVLDQVSLEIRKGDIFGLIGPNGAGKSTLISILTGMLSQDSGEVFVDGINTKTDLLAVKQKIGLVPQVLAVEKEMNAYDNLEYFGAFYGLSGKLLKERIDEALEVTKLKDRAKDKVKTFSGGMMRRLNLGASIMHHPEFLILDEPTVGVDAQSRNYTFDYLREINQQRNTTILYTSHYMEEVESLCNRIYILDLGKEIAYGSKHEILAMNTSHDTIELRLVDDREGDFNLLSSVTGVKNLTFNDGNYRLIVEKGFTLADLVLRLSSNHRQISSISFDQPNLEEVFLSLTGKTLRD